MASRLTTIIVLVIVCATFVAGLIVRAQRDDASGPVDLIVLNGKVYPGLGRPLEEALAVRGNQILRVGSNREIKRLRRAQTVVVDAHGGAVLPGFNDAHVRMLEAALKLDWLDVREATTPENVRAIVGTYASTNPSRLWILGRNGDGDTFAQDVPARALLDEASPDRPAIVVDRDGEVAWANSTALQRAGITRSTRNPHAGTIVKDHVTGEPVGVLKGAAIDLVTRAVPEPSRAEKLAALRSAIVESHRAGVTSVQTVSADTEELSLLNDIRKDGDLTLRVYGSISVSQDATEAEIAKLDDVRERYPDDPLLKAGGVEITCGDGSCNSQSLGRALAVLDDRDWQILLRPAGEEADVQAALDALEQVATANPAPGRERRHRLEDAGADEVDLQRVAKLAVLVETSPTELDTLAARSALQSALATAKVLFGSHWQSNRLNPPLTVQQAIASTSDASEADSPQPPAEALLRSAIDAHTSHAGYASYDEHRKGTLAPGMLADVVVLSNDIFEDSPQRLKEAEVDVTIFDGKIVYQRGESTTDD